MISKGALVNGTYALMRISGLTVDPSPEHITVGLQVADDYAAELSTNLDLSWQYPTGYGESLPSDNSGLTTEMAGPFKKLLFIQLCSYFGKEVPPTVLMTAQAGMRSLEQLLVDVAPAQNPSTLPYGSGNEQSYRDRKFYSEPADNQNAEYVYKGNILNFSHDFSNDPNWLVDEELVTVVWESTGIVIASETFTTTTASAELTFTNVGGHEVCITATKTNSTDKITWRKNFIVSECRPTGMSF